MQQSPANSTETIPHKDPLPANLGQYQPISKLGVGTFGSAYKCIDTQTGNIVAIKAINLQNLHSQDSSLDLLEREITILSGLDHPNILHLYSHFKHENLICLVTNFCNQGTLQELVEREGALGEYRSKVYLQQIMNGFKFLHERRIMHRDFKPENVFIDDDRVVIGDFGFAKEVLEPSQALHSILGTPLIQAPEILEANYLN